MELQLETHGDEKIYYITWENKPVDRRAYKKIMQGLMATRDYSPAVPEKLEKLLNSVNKKYNTDITMDQTIALRNIVLKYKIIKNYSRMNAQISDISDKYDRVGILKLSKQYDFPPLNLLRGILLHRGYDKTKLYSIFANKTTPTELLSGRDLEQYVLAEKNDAESTFNQQQVTKIALANEDRLVDYFVNLKIGLRTQDDLAQQQIAEFGRAVITPDILFTDTVYINGARVNWIDYKDYIGTDIRFLYTSNAAQAAKYTSKWGPGAICFHRSFVEGLEIPGAILLDARATACKFIE